MSNQYPNPASTTKVPSPTKLLPELTWVELVSVIGAVVGVGEVDSSVIPLTSGDGVGDGVGARVGVGGVGLGVGISVGFGVAWMTCGT